MTEIDLVLGCKKANSKAQEELYSLYANRMFRVTYRYVKNQADAEDILISSFNKIFSHIKDFQFNGDGSLAAWIRKIIVNESLMWIRRRHNFHTMGSLDDILQIDLHQLSDVHEEDIYKLITQLPVGYRTVFNLAVIEGYSHQEIATMLGTSEGTSRSQLFKAKKLLREILIKEGFHYGT